MARKLVVQIAMPDGSSKSINISNPKSGLYKENAEAVADSLIENSILEQTPTGLVKAYYEETTITDLNSSVTGS